MSTPDDPSANADRPAAPAGTPLRCPICTKPAAAKGVGGERSAFPFCSERCRLIDLGRWLDGAYQIPADADDPQDDAAAP